MRMSKLLMAFNDIDESYIGRAMDCERHRRGRLRMIRIVSLAACLCLLCGTGVYLWQASYGGEIGIHGTPPSYVVGDTRQFEDGYRWSYLSAEHSAVTVKAVNAAEREREIGVELICPVDAVHDRVDLSTRTPDGDAYYIEVYLNGERIEDGSPYLAVDRFGKRKGLILPADGKEYVLTFDFSRYTAEYGPILWWRFGGSLMVYTAYRDETSAP